MIIKEEDAIGDLEPIINLPTINEISQIDKNAEQNIKQIMADNHILYSLTLELTYLCNERCIHCYVPNNRKLNELTTSQIFALINDFEKLGGFSILLTGGEIFVRSDIKEILKFLTTKNMIISINSNLTLLDNDILNILKDMNIRSIGTSVYSAHSYIHDEITQLKGSFEKTINSIKKIREIGIPVVIKTPLMQTNAPYFEEMEELAKKLSCEIQFDLNITPKNDGDKSTIDLRIHDKNLLSKIFSSNFFSLYLIRRSIVLSCQIKSKIFSSNFFSLYNINDEPSNKLVFSDNEEAILCGAGANSLSVSPDGTIHPCIAMRKVLGKYPDNSLSDIWEHSEFFEYWSNIKLNDIKKCSKCKNKKFCSRCPGSWEIETGSFLIPSSYTCFLADIWHKITIKERR